MARGVLPAGLRLKRRMLVLARSAASASVAVSPRKVRCRAGLPPLSALSSIAALLASVFLLISGNGLINTLVPLRGSLEGFSTVSIGLIGSVYFIGMLSGTIAAPLALRRAGHIRAFCAFITMALVATLALPAAIHPFAWVILRGIIGFAFAGLYGVIDAWIAAKSKNENRGQIYASYQVVNFTGSAVGQQLLALGEPSSFVLFSLTAGLFALAILPLAFTLAEEPEVRGTVRLDIPWLIKMSPVGSMTALIVGSANGSFWSLAPLYGLHKGLDSAGVAQFLFAVVVGSGLAVWPVGRLSDRMDRRRIIAACATLGAFVDVLLWRDGAPTLAGLMALGFALGASTMVLYTLAVAQTNDRTGPAQAVMVSSGLLFFYCVGAIVAPAIGSGLMSSFGESSLFGMNFLLHLSLAGFTLWRMLRRAAAIPAPRPEDAAAGAGPGLPST